MTCEALALRLMLANTSLEQVGEVSENVIIIAALRGYMRFLQFTIPDRYIETFLGQEEMTVYIDLWATPWFDLNSATGRRNAVDNIVAIVRQENAQVQ